MLRCNIQGGGKKKCGICWRPVTLLRPPWYTISVGPRYLVTLIQGDPRGCWPVRWLFRETKSQKQDLFWHRGAVQHFLQTIEGLSCLLGVRRSDFVLSSCQNLEKMTEWLLL